MSPVKTTIEPEEAKFVVPLLAIGIVVVVGLNGRTTPGAAAPKTLGAGSGAPPSSALPAGWSWASGITTS